MCVTLYSWQKYAERGDFSMSDTLYIQTDMNVQVDHPHVSLQDVAKLSGSNSKILNKCRVMQVMNLEQTKPGRYVMSVIEIIQEIQKTQETPPYILVHFLTFPLLFSRISSSSQICSSVSTIL